jgi:2-hydroxy-4-carboxymuconate semialdehyde hemiacetal dehydrogenase
LGESLIKELPSVPGLTLAGVQDARLELAQEVGVRHGSPWAGENFHDLLLLPDVDAVVICTPNALHVPQAAAALRAARVPKRHGSSIANSVAAAHCLTWAFT